MGFLDFFVLLVPPNLEATDYLIISTTSLSYPSGIQLLDDVFRFNTLSDPIECIEPPRSIK